MTLCGNPSRIPAFLTEDGDIDEIVTQVSLMLKASAGVVVTRSIIYYSEREFRNGKVIHCLTRRVYVVEIREPMKRLPDELQWTDIADCSISYSPADGERAINEELRVMATNQVPTQRVSFSRRG